MFKDSGAESAYKTLHTNDASELVERKCWKCCAKASVNRFTMRTAYA